MSTLTLDERRAESARLLADAQSLYERYKDDPDGMPDEAALRYDALLEESDAQIRAVESAERTRSRRERLEAAEAAAKLPRETRMAGGYAGDPDMPHTDRINTRNGRHGYSVLRAIGRSLNEREGKHGTPRLDGLELETHVELAKRRKADSDQEVRGVMIPWDLPVPLEHVLGRGERSEVQYAEGEKSPADFLRSVAEMRTLDTTAGAGSIPTVLAVDMISILRSRLVTASLGATVLTGMRGLFALPRQNGTGTAYWLAEGASPTPSNATIDQVPFEPRTVSGTTGYTRRFISQTSMDAEMMVRTDLAAVLARALESAAFTGSGTDNQPLGLALYPGVPTVSIGPDGGVPSLAHVVALETATATANAAVGDLGYVVNSATRGVLKTVLRASNHPRNVWDVDQPSTPLNGYRAAVTNHLPSNLTKGSGSGLSMALFGNWADLVFALWSDLDIVVDPYTNAQTGGVRIVALQDCDVNLRHPESFAKCVDIKTAA